MTSSFANPLRFGIRTCRSGLPPATHAAVAWVRAAAQPDTLTALPLGSRFEPETEDTLDVADITNSLRSEMVRHMGVSRDRAGLEQAERDVGFWCRYVLPREFHDRAGWELQNLLTIARLMIHSALVREESRGVHFRSDFPERDDAKWQHHVVCAPQGETSGPA